MQKIIIPLTRSKVKSRATEVKSGSRINKPNKHISSFQLIKSMNGKEILKKSYQLHLYSVPFVSTNTHTYPGKHQLQSTSRCPTVKLPSQRDRGSKQHRTPKTLAVRLSADIPAFQLKIQPKTALVSHQRIRNRTLNNGYYSDTGFRPLSLMIFRSLTQNQFSLLMRI